MFNARYIKVLCHSHGWKITTLWPFVDGWHIFFSFGSVFHSDSFEKWNKLHYSSCLGLPCTNFSFFLSEVYPFPTILLDLNLNSRNWFIVVVVPYMDCNFFLHISYCTQEWRPIIIFYNHSSLNISFTSNMSAKNSLMQYFLWIVCF